MRLSGHPRRLCLLLAAGTAAVAPATAHAATVGESAGSLSFAAAPGEANDVTIAPFGLALKVTDTSAKGGKNALGVGTGCWKLSNNSAACAVPPNGIQFEAGDGDDRLDASALMVTRVNANGG